MSKTKSLTARFYRLRASTDGEDIDLTGLDIRAILSAYRARDADERYREVRGSRYLFAPAASHPLGLAIHRLRDSSDSLTVVDRDGSVGEVMAVDEAGRAYADTSCVLFDASRAMFSFVRGAGTAPTAHRVAEWLTDLRPLVDFSQAEFTVVPMTSKARLEAIGAADGARKLELEFPVSVQHQLGLSLTADRTALEGLDPETVVKISLSTGNRRPEHQAGEKLLDIVKGFVPILGSMHKAKVGVYQEVPTNRKKNGKQQTRLEPDAIDLMETILAAKFALPVNGSRVRIENTLAAMEREERSLQTEILDAWESDDQHLLEVDRPSQC